MLKSRDVKDFLLHMPTLSQNEHVRTALNCIDNNNKVYLMSYKKYGYIFTSNTQFNSVTPGSGQSHKGSGTSHILVCNC
jgi:hypothetical protein